MSPTLNFLVTTIIYHKKPKNGDHIPSGQFSTGTDNGKSLILAGMWNWSKLSVAEFLCERKMARGYTRFSTP